MKYPLAPEGGTLRLVTAVHLAMAVGAGLPDDVDVAQTQLGSIVGPTRVAGGYMTLLAEHRFAGLEQVIVHGGVRQMAVTAILLYRLVFKQKRPAGGRMALVANLVDAGGSEPIHGGTAVRRMAVAALQVAFLQRVAGKAHLLRPFSFMAAGTDLKFQRILLYRIGAGVNSVACRTAGAGMGTECPVRRLFAVTGQTGGGAGVTAIIRAEADSGPRLHWRAGVRRTGTVAVAAAVR